MSTDKLKIIVHSSLYNSMPLSLLDILLDETLIYGTAYIPQEHFKTISTFNRRLPAKQEYELLLRMAEHFPIEISSSIPTDSDRYIAVSVDETLLDENSLKADCYILSRYKKLLLDNDFFDAAAESILMQANTLGIQEHILIFMSDMITENKHFLYYDLGSAPFLIYTGDSVCYNILCVFAKELGNALTRQGQIVEYYDFSKNDIFASARLYGRRFQAVIGIQTYMFSVRLNNNDFLHNHIIGPKYNFLFDHPAYFDHHLQKTPSGLTILTLDRNYASFAETHYSVKTRFLPPGGILTEAELNTKRIYDVTFIASYYNLSTNMFETIHSLDRQMRFLINRLWLLMRKNPSQTSEDSLSIALSYYNRELNNEQFLSLYKELKPYTSYIISWYRCKVLKTLLDANIPVHVYGTSWGHSSLREHPCFIWHPQDLSTSECLSVWQQTKIALNVMTWHKDAITERILNSMLQKCVVATERNPYICEEFDDNTDLILYDLEHLEDLPLQIKFLLANPELCSNISENGYKKALASHTWDNRATELISIANDDSI